MTLDEFRKATEGLDGSLELAVDLAPSGHLTCSSTVAVARAGQGFDWEHGKLVIATERPVDLWTARCRECDLRDDCRVTSKMRCTDLKTFEHELTVYLDGKPKFKVAYSADDLRKKKG